MVIECAHFKTIEQIKEFLRGYECCYDLSNFVGSTADITIRDEAGVMLLYYDGSPKLVKGNDVLVLDKNKFFQISIM